MAKRFTDTGKWDKAWFRQLAPAEKCVWMFLCDRCDHAGVWEADYDALEFFIGESFSAGDLEHMFRERIQIFGDKVLLKGFADFQYGQLNPENRVHRSVLDRLERLEKLATIKDLPRTLLGTKDTDTDKDTDKDSLERGSGGKPFRPTTKDLDRLYAEYPRKEGKSRGYKKLKGDFASAAEMDWFLLAVGNYRNTLKRKGTGDEFVKLFSTFAHEWRDWLDPSHGQSEDFSSKPVSLDEIKLHDYSQEGA